MSDPKTPMSAREWLESDPNAEWPQYSYDWLAFAEAYRDHCSAADQARIAKLEAKCKHLMGCCVYPRNENKLDDIDKLVERAEAAEAKVAKPR